MIRGSIGLGLRCVDPIQVNIYGAKIGINCTVGAFTEIGPSIIGDNCSISGGCFIPEGIIIRSNVFIGPHVVFCNDKYPPSCGKWREGPPTIIKDNVSIGAGSIILPGIEIGKGALIGAGSVVTKNIKAGAIVFGNPAKEKEE
jgi:acetyltransferase-like isoleucine patch superfamily enzyme